MALSPMNSRTVLARILDLLDSPMPSICDEYPPCECTRCRRARRRPLRCRVCGYEGEPFVYPCECSSAQKKGASPGELEWYSTRLRQAEADGKERDANELRESLAALLTDGRLPLCGLNSREQGCCHGGRACPVCHATKGDPRTLDWVDEEKAFHAWNIVKAIRGIAAPSGHGRRATRVSKRG